MVASVRASISCALPSPLGQTAIQPVLFPRSSRATDPTGTVRLWLATKNMRPATAGAMVGRLVRSGGVS
jgi:hypothetical protein